MEPRDLVVHSSGGDVCTQTVELSPFDVFCRGRAVPMVWFYYDTLNADALLVALERTLTAYPVFAGRYASPATAVRLCNAGVPVRVCTEADYSLSSAISHLSEAQDPASPSIFKTDRHARYVPSKQCMDPDTAAPDVPLLAIKITRFSSGGTAIGILFQHGVADAESGIMFVRNWSRMFRELDLDPVPGHDRLSALRSSIGNAVSNAEKPACAKFQSLPAADVGRPPAFAAVMPLIAGDSTAIVAFPQKTLKHMKAAASVGLADPRSISTDDVLTATTWQSLCEMRIAQVGLPQDSDAITTCCRACNVRARTDPPLGRGYCGNGVTHVCTDLSVRELLAMSISDIAQRLRQSLMEHSPAVLAASAQWLCAQQQEGCQTTQTFDRFALTFIVSSWRFDWESANFHSTPVAFDHGALVPIVSTFTPRGHIGDGINVYASGPQSCLEHFGRLMAAKAISTSP